MLKDYWQRRQANKASQLTPSRQRIAQQQKGCCPICGEPLANDEPLDVHHRLPKTKGGLDTYSNLEMLHLFCHQQVHAESHQAGSA
ncbi:MAG: HNH endonuclease signature motif containing protein [Elainellaceae cyanobacterium]